MLFRKSSVLIMYIAIVSSFTFAAQNTGNISLIPNTKLFVSSLPDLNGQISGEITFQSKGSNCRQSTMQANLLYNGQGCFGLSDDLSEYFLIYYKDIKYIFKGKVCLPADGEKYGALSGLSFSSADSGAMRSGDGKQTASGAITITGSADMEIPKNVKSITFESSVHDSLVFLLTENGFSYVSGSGKVYSANKKKYEFSDNVTSSENSDTINRPSDNTPKTMQIWENGLCLTGGNLMFQIGEGGDLNPVETNGPKIIIWRSFGKSEKANAAKRGLHTGIAYLQTNSGKLKIIRKVNLNHTNDQLEAEFGINVN